MPRSPSTAVGSLVTSILATLIIAGCGRRAPRSAPGDSAHRPAERARAIGHAGATAPAGVPADGTAACSAGELAVERLGMDAGAGQRAMRIGVRNVGSAPCELAGYAGIVLLDSSGDPVRGLRVEHESRASPGAVRTPDRVRLSPGALAAFDLEWTVVEGEPGGCLEGTAIAVVPPGERADAPRAARAAAMVRAPVRACGARVRVTPIVPAAPS